MSYLLKDGDFPVRKLFNDQRISHFDHLPIRWWPAESAGTPNSRHHDLGLSISGIFRWGFWGEIQETIGYRSFETLNLVDLPSRKFT